MREIAGREESDASHRPLLVVLCGPSHAGKTTFANRLSKSGKNFVIISPDEIRKRMSVSFEDHKHEAKVWDIYESMKCKSLKAGRNVVLDACHMSERARWHALQGPNAHYRKICIVFDLPLRVVRERCLCEKRVSPEEVERMWQDFQNNKPTVEELEQLGFDEIYFVKEFPEGTVQPVKQRHNSVKASITVCGCQSTYKQNNLVSMFHYLRVVLMIRPEGQWYNKVLSQNE